MFLFKREKRFFSTNFVASSLAVLCHHIPSTVAHFSSLFHSNEAGIIALNKFMSEFANDSPYAREVIIFFLKSDISQRYSNSIL
jgi:hypothetical protein